MISDGAAAVLDYDVGGFAKKSRPQHMHTANCFHDQIISTEPNEERNLKSCAAAQLLNGLPPTLERFMGKGTLPTALHQAKVSVAQSIVPKEIASGEVDGLINPLAHLLSRSSDASDISSARSFIKFGIDKRGDKSNEQMTEDLIAGKDTQRKVIL